MLCGPEAKTPHLELFSPLFDQRGKDGSMAATTEGKFRKVRVKALGVKEYGRYRGRGRLTIHEEGIEIEGRHVMSIGARWGIGVLLVFASAIATMGAVILGFIPVYLLVEYAILKREDLSVSWAEVRRYAFDPSQKLVSLDFVGPEWTSPSVMRTQDLASVAQALREKAPEKDATPSLQIA
jgi:hypothetical protein